MGETNRQPIQSYNMKSLGLVLSLSLLLSATAQPIFFPEAVAASAFTVAGGLVLTGASGATLATIPTAALVAGKVLLAKKAIVGGALVADALASRNNNRRH